MLKKILLIAAALLFVGAGAAHAQDYPPRGNSLTASASVVAAGTPVTLTAQVFLPGTNVVFRIFSDPVTLGTATANSNGVATLTATIPSNFSGQHTITASGSGANGQPLTVSTTITVTQGHAPLPRTGSSHTKPYTEIGIGALAVGGLLLLGAKRRRSAHAAS